jgi:hypothetical protein
VTPERKAELEAKIVRMRSASNSFYRDAAYAGVHPFIEFAGLMNEYLELCQDALKQDVDYSQVSVHGSTHPPPMHPVRAAYLAEKFGCIFARYFEASDPACAAEFIRDSGLSAAAQSPDRES